LCPNLVVVLLTPVRTHMGFGRKGLLAAR
jgi:hypothetical protein